MSENYPWVGGLNGPQREAALYEGGPLLIVAGAGSGKTRAIVHRIAHMIKGRGADPSSILAVTFTNKAAEEMEERVAELLGPDSGRVWVSTFHKFGAAVLRQEGHLLGYKNSFAIYDESDQTSLLRSIVKEKGFDAKTVDPKSIKPLIEKLKRQAVPESEFGRHADPRIKVHLDIIETYQQRLRAAGAMDFSDLLYLTHKLFSEFPEVLERYRGHFQHFLIDEYQDTNHLQYLLVQLLAGEHADICVVGDEDQSIYGWRGANIDNILSFERDFKNAKVIMLEQNYRSTKTIIEASSELIGHNSERKPKRLWTDKGEGKKIRLFTGADDREEARWVVEDIMRKKGMGRGLSDMAVFYRTHAQSRVIEDQLRSLNIAYKVFGGTRFYDRKEVKDILAYMAFLTNPFDEVALFRIINTPPRGIGAGAQAKVAEQARETGGDWPARIEALLGSGSLSGRAYNSLMAFLRMIEELLPLAEGSVAALAGEIMEKSGYMKKLEEEDTDEARSRVENLEELINAVTEYEARAPRASARGFLEEITLAASIDDFDSDEGSLSMMTLHNAKGLEFDVVYMVGMVDGLLPHSRAIYEEDPKKSEREMEEERRLCYVGMTRAREELAFSWGKARLVRGRREVCSPSLFLREVPDMYVKQEGGLSPMRRPERRFDSYRKKAEPRSLDFGDSQIVYDEDMDTGSYTDGDGMTMKPGDRVFHPTYGEGVIKRLEESGKNRKVVVKFGRGTKKFAAAFAPLKPI